LAASVGLVLDPWQRHVLDGALGERADGRWSAFEVGLLVSRQNGKGSILEARELAGLFLFNEQLIIHSAHEFKTAQEHFRRVLSLVTNYDHLRKLVSRVRTSHGEEGIELKTGQRLRFVARTGPSGRGFSGDVIVLDEAMILSPAVMAALLPTMSARPNPQVWYTASAGFPDSNLLRAVRERGKAGGDPGLAWFEWSAPEDASLDDRAAWAAANPALGIRVAEEFVQRERAAMPEVEFARERLGMWDAGGRDRVIPLEVWNALEDPKSQPDDRLAFALDATPNRESASIGLAGRRPDGWIHVEVVENRAGIDWLVQRTVELQRRWLAPVYLDPAGPVGSIAPALEAAGVEFVKLNATDYKQACGSFYDHAMERKLRHIGQPLLNAALGSARKRDLGDAWAWHRRDYTDISPLVSVTNALYGLLRAEIPVPVKGLTRVSGRVRSY
jgi:phage terminase large subunit-like protein